MRYFFICFVIILFSLPAISVAQDQCALALSEAEDKYDQGRLYEIPEMLQSCLEYGFSKEEKIRAYRLLTLSYLFLNYYNEADSLYLKLLRLSPEHNINDELDPKEIINHHKKFTTKPVYYITMGKLGINLAQSNVLIDYSISESSNKSEKYSSVVGFHAGVGAEMVLYKNLHLSGEFFLSMKSLHLRDTHWGFYTTDMDISHSEIELPIMLKYNFWKNKINPFVSAGISPSILYQSNVRNVQGVYLLADEEFPVQPRPEISTTKLKNSFNYSLQFGGGFNYKIGLNYLVIEARYAVGMLNVTNTKNRWREDFTEGRELKFPVGHIDDDFKVNNLSFFVGFVRPLYKPRKIK